MAPVSESYSYWFSPLLLSRGAAKIGQRSTPLHQVTLVFDKPGMDDYSVRVRKEN